MTMTNSLLSRVVNKHSPVEEVSNIGLEVRVIILKL